MAMENLFFDNQAHLSKMFTYMCSQCTAPEDPISNMACHFLHRKLFISLGVAGITFFEDGIIYPYFYLSREQRQYLYSIASAISRDPKDCPLSYRFCNGCMILTDFTGRTLNQKLMWRVILMCVSESKKHGECVHMLANVLVQRVLCKIQLSKDMIEYVHHLVDELFTARRNGAAAGAERTPESPLQLQASSPAECA